MAQSVSLLSKSGLLRQDLDYHLIRASMVLTFAMFGYQKWFEYEAQTLIPYISSGPLIFWMYPVFGIRGATWFLGVAEWLFGALLLAGFWNKKLGVLGALGSVASFMATVTIIPFIPGGWEKSAGGFPAMVGPVAFLMKDVVLLAVSVYLLKEDMVRLTRDTDMKTEERMSKAAVIIGVVALGMLLTVPLRAQADVRGSTDGGLRIRLMQPTVVTTGENAFEVVIEGSDGRVIKNASVSVSFVMSAWPIKRIPEIRNDVTLRSDADGRYTGTWNVSLPGPWLTTVIVKKNGTKIGRKQFVLIAY